MSYTNNTPQANQQIASTQGPILANFQFIQSSIGQEHNFNASDPTQTYHLKASMPNIALSPAIPGGCNGVFFVSNNSPYFYDGTTNFQLNTQQAALTGSFTTPGNNSSFVITTVPANTFGQVFVYKNNGLLAQSGQYVSDTNKAYAFSNAVVLDSNTVISPLFPPPIQLINNPGGGGIQIKAFANYPSYQGVGFTFLIFYRPR